MKRRKLIFSFAGVVAVMALLAFLWKPMHFDEPWQGGKPLSSWLEEYGEGPRDYKPSTNADDAIRRMGPRAVPVLLRLLRATNSSGYILHTNTLRPGLGGWFWIQAPPTNLTLKIRVQNFVEKHTAFRFHHLPRPPSWDHWKAFLGFQALGPGGKPAIPELAKLAADPAASHLYPNVQSLKDLKGVAGLAVNSKTYLAADDGPGIGSVTRNTNTFLVDGEIAAWSLAAIGGESVTPLAELLNHSTPGVRSRGAQALGMTGAAAESAVPALLKCLRDPDRDVRMRAADALGWIARQPAIAVPALIDTLADREFGVRYYAVEALGRFRDQARNAIPALLRNTADGDYRVRDAAAIALSRISPQTAAEQVLPKMLAQLKGPEVGSRNMVLIALSQMRDESDLVVPAFIELLDETNSMLRNNAVIGLGRFGPDAKAALPKLLQMTNDPDIRTREHVATALKNIQTPSTATRD